MHVVFFPWGICKGNFPNDSGGITSLMCFFQRPVCLLTSWILSPLSIRGWREWITGLFHNQIIEDLLPTTCSLYWAAAPGVMCVNGPWRDFPWRLMPWGFPESSWEAGLHSISSVRPAEEEEIALCSKSGDFCRPLGADYEVLFRERCLPGLLLGELVYGEDLTAKAEWRGSRKAILCLLSAHDSMDAVPWFRVNSFALRILFHLPRVASETLCRIPANHPFTIHSLPRHTPP